MARGTVACADSHRVFSRAPVDVLVPVLRLLHTISMKIGCPLAPDLLSRPVASALEARAIMQLIQDMRLSRRLCLRFDPLFHQPDGQLSALTANEIAIAERGSCPCYDNLALN